MNTNIPAQSNCRISVLTATLCIILNCALLPCIAQRRNLLETGNFESPNDKEITNPYRSTNQIIGPFTIERCDDLAAGTRCPPSTQVVSFVNDPAGGANRVAKFVMQTIYERAEVRAQRNGYPEINPATGATLWYGWRLYVPVNSGVSGYGGIVSQFHPGQQAAAKGVKGSPTTLRINENNWSFYIKYQTGISGDTILYNNEEFNLGSCAGDRGRWTEWVMQVQWTPANTGFIRLWKNGVQVIGGSALAQWENHATFYDIDRCPNFKMGMYRGDPNWKGPDNMTLYGDDYRMGNSNATYNDVAPTPLR